MAVATGSKAVLVLRRAPHSKSQSQRSPSVLPALLLITSLLFVACEEPPPPPPPPPPPGTQVQATVASFRVSTGEGNETVERIAVSDNLVRFPNETEVWHLYDISAGTVTRVDEISREVERRSFESVLDELRTAARQTEPIPAATVQPAGEAGTFAGFEAEKFVVTIGTAYQREMWISRRTLFHSDLFLLRLAADEFPAENLPALRRVITLLDRLEGYPVHDRSTMKLDGRDYTIERTLIAVADQSVPRTWFELPAWARQQVS